jgi:CRP-like cAMP-binding protein
MLLERLPFDQPLEHWLVTWSLVGEAFDTLRAYAEEMRFGAGDIIFGQGDPSDGMYLILEGMALIFTTDTTGGERALSLVTEGQSFGELGLLTGQPRNASVAAGLDVRLLKITPDALARLETEQPDLVMRIYKSLAQTLAEQWIRVGPWAKNNDR